MTYSFKILPTCRERVVQSESLTNVQLIWTIFCSFCLSPLRHLAYLMRAEYGWSTWDRAMLGHG